MKRKLSDRKTVDNNSQKIFSKRYESELKATTKYLKENYGSDVIIHHKMSYTYFPRRIKAYSNYAKFICETVGDIVTEIDIEKELSFIGSLPFMSNLDLLNNFFHLSLAIAIYILDTLKDCDCLSEAIPYIPSEREVLNTVVLPEKFHYPTYSNELIKGVILLIESRNQNTYVNCSHMDVFYNESICNHNPMIIEPGVGAVKSHPSMIQSMSYKQRLNHLISYIPQAVLVKAEENFKEAIDHCIVLILKEFEYIEEKQYEQNEDMQPLSEVQKTALKVSTIFNFIDHNRYGLLSTQKTKKDRFKIINPYEICFAAFYLLNYKDDDYVWLIELCGIIVEMACEMLPWYLRPDFSSLQEIEYLYTPVSTLNAVYFRSWDGATNDESDVSIIKDTICKIVYRKEHYVLPQNNALLRRFMFTCKGTFEIILELGLLIIATPIFVLILHELYKHKSAPVPIALVIIILILVSHRRELHNLNITLLKRIFRRFLIRRITRTSEIGFPKSLEDIKSKEEFKKEIDELKRSISEQKEELARYRSQMHDATKAIEEQKKQFDVIKAKYDADSLELAELRETIYNIQNSTELELEVQNIVPHFPYTSKKKIIIVGGYEKWIIAMKRYIPNAIYINPSSLNFDVTLIKNADVLWLQTNAMPHSLYYKIIDRARSNNILIKYFSFPSAKKCAVQIYMDEEVV